MSKWQIPWWHCGLCRLAQDLATAQASHLTINLKPYYYPVTILMHYVELHYKSSFLDLVDYFSISATTLIFEIREMTKLLCRLLTLKRISATELHWHDK